MIDHVGFEVSDLHRSAAFYDVLFFALGGRRMHETEHAIAYGINGPELMELMRQQALNFDERRIHVPEQPAIP